MRRFARAAGGVPISFMEIEGSVRKLGAAGTWYWFVLLICVGVLPNAGAQTVTYIHTDALGSVVAESEESGNVVKRYDYEPYGVVVGEQTWDGPGYAGHVSDSATGLSYMQQRYMDPQLGMFLSTDPVTAYQRPIEQFNRYRYANGKGPHTQRGQRDGRNGKDDQAREFDGSGRPVKTIDFTDHGRPGNHTNPHEHPHEPSATGGTPSRGRARPLNGG